MYLQQHAVGIVAGSWDYAVFVRDGDFETLVAHIPFPGSDDPLFGQQVLGLIAEGGGGPEAMLGVTRTSRHPEIALDFLRFLSSHPSASRFTERSRRISAIAEVPPPPDAPGLAPLLEGEVPGLAIDFQHFGGNHSYTLFQRHLHALIGPEGGVDAFLDAFTADLRPALRRDLAQHVARTARSVESLDARVALLLSLPAEAEDPVEVSRLLEARLLRQIERRFYERYAEP